MTGTYNINEFVEDLFKKDYSEEKRILVKNKAVISLKERYDKGEVQCTEDDEGSMLKDILDKMECTEIDGQKSFVIRTY